MNHPFIKRISGIVFTVSESRTAFVILSVREGSSESPSKCLIESYWILRQPSG